MAKAKNNADLRRRMYIYFRDYEGAGYPSISKFAKGVGLTVAELEKYYGVALFDRIHQRLVLTKTGEELLPKPAAIW